MQFFVVGAPPTRGRRALHVHVSQASAHVILQGKGSVRILVDEALSADKSAYLGALTAESGAVVGAHRHSDSSEYLFVLEGRAEMEIGTRTIRVQAGDAVQIPPGVLHRAEVTSADAFKALQFYAPAGPEQRFKGGAK